MEALVGLFALGLGVVLLALPIVALVALTRANRALRELEEMRGRLQAGGRWAPVETGGPRESPPPAAARTTPPLPPAAPTPPASPTPAARPAARPDFATNLGPRILVGAGGLAVVVFLAFLGRYAW